MKKYLILGIVVGIAHALFAGSPLTDQLIENAEMPARNLPAVSGEGCCIKVDFSNFTEESELLQEFHKRSHWLRDYLSDLPRYRAVACIQNLLISDSLLWDEIIHSVAEQPKMISHEDDRWDRLIIVMPNLPPTINFEVHVKDYPAPSLDRRSKYQSSLGNKARNS